MSHIQTKLEQSRSSVCQQGAGGTKRLAAAQDKQGSKSSPLPHRTTNVCSGVRRRVVLLTLIRFPPESSRVEAEFPKFRRIAMVDWTLETGV